MKWLRRWRMIHKRKLCKLVEVGRLPRGYTLYRCENGVGGQQYWSDEIGGGVMVWDTTLVSTVALIAAMNDHIRRWGMT